MREHFPSTVPGDLLTSRHVNDLSRVCERFGQANGGSFVNVQHGSTLFSFAGLPPFKQMPFEISYDLGSGLFYGKMRYYSLANSQWETDDKQWEIDASVMDPYLIVGDLVQAYWSPQRRMFLPTWVLKYGKCKGITAQEVSDSDEEYEVGQVTPYNGRSPVESADDTIMVVNTFEDTIASGARVTFSWNQVEHTWETDDVAC